MSDLALIRLGLTSVYPGIDSEGDLFRKPPESLRSKRSGLDGLLAFL